MEACYQLSGHAQWLATAPHTNTHTDPQGPSLVRHEAEVTLTLHTPKPLAKAYDFLQDSVLWAEKTELSLWLLHMVPAGEPTELLPVHSHNVLCHSPVPAAPPAPPQPSLMS